MKKRIKHLIADIAIRVVLWALEIDKEQFKAQVAKLWVNENDKTTRTS